TGEVSIFSADKESLDQAVAWIKSIVSVPEVGDVFDGTVKGVKEFGAFVEFLPNKQGLLHISEISWKRLESMDNIFQEGDKVQVKLIGVDSKTGKFKLSHKALLPRPEQHSAPRNEND
ncbi:MAG: S1 RNA-binding domain-containing protein, partial [Ginsengibacter sp.]